MPRTSYQNTNIKFTKSQKALLVWSTAIHGEEG